MVIFKGKMQQPTWYEDKDLPKDCVLAVSDNGWTSNELGLRWLRDIFDKHTASKAVGKYRLLILDGHRSHATPEFDLFCKEKLIISLCMPAHSSHLLQPLVVGCFPVLIRSYGRQVAEYTRLGVNHIDKPEFLNTFKQARIEALSKSNIQSGFAATGLVPLDAEQVLATLQIKPATLSPISIVQESWHPETPHNLIALDQLVLRVRSCN